MRRDPEDILIVVIWPAGIVAVAAALIAFGIWQWREAADKRDCRRAGGSVVRVDDRGEWHCVGARPEAP